MCGIYGFQVRPGHEITEYEAAIMSLTLATGMESRGRDSFGGVGLPTPEDEEKTAQIIKGLGKVTESGKELFKLAASSRYFLGHTRAATTGAVTIPNAHPFRIGDVLGVHNGIVTNHQELNRKYERGFEVDSMHIFAHINDNLPLTDIHGYGTFFWSRSSEHWSRVYLARTIGGSLSVVKLFRPGTDIEENKDKHFALIWASEIDALRKVAYLLGTPYTIVNVNPDEIHFICDGIIYTTNKPFVLASHFRPERAVHYSLDEDEQYLVERMHGVDERGPNCKLTETRNANKYLTRKERKALKKQRSKQKKSARESAKEQQLDPTVANIATNIGLRFIFLPINGHNGEAIKHFLCPECNCLLDDHMYGWCPNNGSKASSCKADKLDASCITGLPMCADCGHYLLDGIHIQAVGYGLEDIVYCNSCENYCAPEASLTNEDGETKEETDPDEEDSHPPVLEEDIKPTQIVLHSAASLRAKDLLDEDLRLIQEFNGTV